MRIENGRLKNLPSTFQLQSSIFYSLPSVVNLMLSYYLFAVAAVFLQGLFSWSLLVLAVVLVAAARQEAGKVFSLAFIAGILSDLLLGESLGVTAVFLILAGASVYIYKLRARINWLSWLLIFAAWEAAAKFLWA